MVWTVGLQAILCAQHTNRLAGRKPAGAVGRVLRWAVTKGDRRKEWVTLLSADVKGRVRRVRRLHCQSVERPAAAPVGPRLASSARTRASCR